MTEASPAYSPRTPLVSVVMVNRNKRAFIGEAIESVMEQTFTDWELLIADNGSEDGSEEVIRKYKAGSANVQSLRLGGSTGIFDAANRAIEMARGGYIARLDSDDVWLPKKLERQIGFLEDGANRDVGVCGSHCRVIDEQGNVRWIKRFPETNGEILAALRFRNPFLHSATVIRKECFATCGGYDETLSCAGDLELWFKISQRYGFYNIQEPLACYRPTPDGVSLKRHREVVRCTLLARRQAYREYGFRRDFLMRAVDVLIAASRFLPPRAVFMAFNRVVLPLTLVHSKPRGGEETLRR